MKPLRIAVTKGRLLDETMLLFERAGIDCSGFSSSDRRLILPISDGEIEIILAKAPDIITYVEYGVCDMGIVGKDIIMEYASKLYEILDLKIGNCYFAVAGLPELKFAPNGRNRRAATKYMNVAKRHFDKQRKDVDLIKIEGSVELAPLLGLADMIVDIVETGKTLHANGLVVYEKIHPISARLVVNNASMKLRKQEIETIAMKLELAINMDKQGV